MEYIRYARATRRKQEILLDNNKDRNTLIRVKKSIKPLIRAEKTTDEVKDWRRYVNARN